MYLINLVKILTQKIITFHNFNHLDTPDAEKPLTIEFQPRTTRSGRAYFAACLRASVRTVQPDYMTGAVPVTCVPQHNLNNSYTPLSILLGKPKDSAQSVSFSLTNNL